MLLVSFRGYVLASLALTTAVISHAVYAKRFFYRAVVHMSSSKFAILAVGNMCFVFFLLLWRIVQSIFLGPLRFREVERLQHRARDAIIECCFAMTIFRDEFNLRFLTLVTVLLLMKSMHWLAKDRIEYLEEQPLTPARTHARLVGLMALLVACDLRLVVMFSTYTLRTRGPTMLVLFAFEFTVLLIDLLSYVVRYIFHLVDLFLAGRWEAKGLYTFYNELVCDLCQLAVYITFFLYVQFFYTFPLHIVRDLYLTFTKFQKRCVEFVRYRRVVATMNEVFPNATEDELVSGDRTCIICREEMTAAKKLNCGHMFHYRCLRSWLKRQLSCPTCRAAVDVLENPATTPNQGGVNGANIVNNARNGHGDAPAPGVIPVAPAPAQAQPQQGVVNGAHVPENPDQQQRDQDRMANIVHQLWVSFANMAAAGQGAAGNPVNPNINTQVHPGNLQARFVERGPVPPQPHGYPQPTWPPMVPAQYAYPVQFIPQGHLYQVPNVHPALGVNNGIGGGALEQPADANTNSSSQAAVVEPGNASAATSGGSYVPGASGPSSYDAVNDGGNVSDSTTHYHSQSPFVHLHSVGVGQSLARPVSSIGDGQTLNRLIALQEDLDKMRHDLAQFSNNFDKFRDELVQMTMICIASLSADASAPGNTHGMEATTNLVPSVQHTDRSIDTAGSSNDEEPAHLTTPSELPESA